MANLVEHFDVSARIRARCASDRRLIDGDQLVEMLQPFNRFVGTRRTFAAVQIAAQRLDEDVVHQRTLPRTGHAGDADERAQRDFGDDVLEVVVRRANDPQLILADRSSLRWHLDPGSAGKILPRHAARFLHQLRRRALDDHFAAANSRSGPEVDDVIGGPHRVFVVLDNDDRVPHVAEAAERVEQTRIVARVESDRWLVQDVQHADQPRTDLPRQTNTLRFAAGQRGSRAVQRQVIEPDVEQEPETPADLFQRFGRDQRLRRIEHQLVEEVDRVADREVAHMWERSRWIVHKLRMSRRNPDRTRLLI